MSKEFCLAFLLHYTGDIFVRTERNKVPTEYLRLYATSIVLSNPLVRFKECRIYMNNSICIFLHLQCNTGPSHMCNLQNSFTKLIQSEYRVQAGAGEHRSGGKVWKDPAFQSKKKEKSHHPTSDVMSECSSNMDLAEQLLASLFPTNTLLPSSVILLLMPLLCITV